MFEELGDISNGYIPDVMKEVSYPRIVLNIKVDALLLKEVKKLDTGYDVPVAIIISNLLAKDKLGYSRDKAYTEPKKYNKKGISNYKIMRAIDCLVNLGLVNNYVASRSFNNDYIKEISHIEATPLLFQMFSKYKKIVDKSKKSYVQDRQCIILKDKDNNRIEYRDTDNIKYLRSKLTDYNIYASAQSVELYGNKLSTTLDAHFKHSFNEYGRLFGADYQTVKKEYRKDIKHNSGNIIEIDYKNLHFRMLLDIYLLSHHVDINTDLYEYPLSEIQRVVPENRDVIKTMFNMIINCTSRNQACQAMQGQINEGEISKGTFSSVKEIYQCLTDAYPFIFDNPSVMANLYSGKPMAAMLQNKEGFIALDVLSTCKQLGFYASGIHDSFLTDASNSYLLAKIIGDCYRKEMNTSAGVPVSVILGDRTWKQIV